MFTLVYLFGGEAILLQTHFGNHALWLAFVLFLLARGVTLWLMAPGAIFKKQ